MNRVIAIDGPSGAGKSTIARGISRNLGFLHVDSGSLYRILTLAVLRAGVDPENADAVVSLAEKTPLEFKIRDGAVFALLGGEEPGDEIRTPEINKAVSPVSKLPRIREIVTTALRKMISLGDLVVEGRDIGSVVFPDSPARFYLDASAEARARRRHLEDKAKGIASGDEKAVMDSLLTRDKIDSTRKTAPLKIPDGAIVIDSTSLGADEVLEIVAGHAMKAFGMEK